MSDFLSMYSSKTKTVKNKVQKQYIKLLQNTK